MIGCARSACLVLRSAIDLGDEKANPFASALAGSGREEVENWSRLSFRRELKQEKVFKVLKEWEGVVEEVEGEEIQVRLTDLNDRTTPQELVRVGLDSISPQDHDLVEPGAVFYWTVLQERDALENVRSFSQIRFRRLPAWSSGDLERAEAEAIKLRQELFGGSDQ